MNVHSQKYRLISGFSSLFRNYSIRKSAYLNVCLISSERALNLLKSEAVMRDFEHTSHDFKHFLPLKAFKIKTERHNFHRRLEKRWLTFVC